MNRNLLDHLLASAGQALAEYSTYNQEQVDACVKAICLAFKDHAEELARETIDETGLGDYSAKVEKNLGSPDGIWYALKGKKSVDIIGYDEENKLAMVAKPKGILCSVAPTTNPNITVLFNAAFALKGRNVLIVAPHPRAKKTTFHTCQIMNEALAKLGAPAGLIQCIEEPSVELTRMLMAESDVIIATGGAAMVRSAYSSGHPAFGVGPGNVQTIFDRDCDLPAAVAQTVMGRKFDNGLICAGNQSFIVPEDQVAEVVTCLQAEKAFYTDDEAVVEQFRQVLFPADGRISAKVVGQPIADIAKLAGVDIPADTSIVVLKTDARGAADPLCGEKMCPVAILTTYHSFEEGVEIAKANLLYEGAGHSAVVHTRDDKKAEYCGVTLPVCRMLVNQPGIFAANPALANGFNPTSTLGCGSWGNNSIAENLTYEHLINISRIGWMKDADTIPTSQQIWAE